MDRGMGDELRKLAEVVTRSTDVGEVAIVQFASGDLDLCEREALTKLLSTGTVSERPAVIDLSKVKYIDSTILQILLTCFNLASKSQRQVVIVRKEGTPVARFLDMTNISGVIPTYSDLESGVGFITDGVMRPND
jgi:anti-anti-sigma factor